MTRGTDKASRAKEGEGVARAWRVCDERDVRGCARVLAFEKVEKVDAWETKGLGH